MVQLYYEDPVHMVQRLQADFLLLQVLLAMPSEVGGLTCKFIFCDVTSPTFPKPWIAPSTQSSGKRSGFSSRAKMLLVSIVSLAAAISQRVGSRIEVMLIHVAMFSQNSRVVTKT